MIDLTDLGAVWRREGRVVASLPDADAATARAFADAHAHRWAARLAPIAVPAGPPEIALRGDGAAVEQPYRLLPARASESVVPTSPEGDDAATTLPTPSE